VVAFVMLPGVLAALEQHGLRSALGYLDFAVPVAYYLYVPLAAAYAAFGRPVVDDVLGTSLSPENLDVLWNASRIFLLMNLVAAVLVPAGAVLLAMRRYRAIVTAALSVFIAYAIALALVWDSGPTTIAIVQAAAGAVLIVPLLGLGFGRMVVPSVLRALRRSLPVVPIALVFPLLGTLHPASIGPSVGLSIVGMAAYVALGFIAWPAVGRRAILMLVARG
jgi:hypothetical protein